MNDHKTFVFKTRQTHELKAAICALCDPALNPKGLARVDVNDRGVHLTVSNVDTYALGNLKLEGTNSCNFVYSHPFDSRMLHLDRVFRYLALADDHDTVTIYHVLESDELSFLFGNNPPIEFSAKLLEPVAELQPFPVVHAPCGAVLPSEHLRQMISLELQENKPQHVSVKMTAKDVKITVGSKEWRYEGDEEIKATKGWQLGEEFSWYFQWPQPELLMYTSYLSKAFLLSFTDDPPSRVMLRFSVSQSWDLTYICSSISNLKKSVRYNFSFLLCPVEPLKQALQSLTDWSFCKAPGLGMIQVSSTCVDIAVRNPDTEVIGLIHLVNTGLINFKYKDLLEEKMVNVNDIAQNLSLALDTDSVSFSQVQGSNEIVYRTGPVQLNTYAAELLEMDDTFQECPYNITIACEVTLPSKHLREMIPLMAKKKIPQIVTLEIQYGFVSITVGLRSWDCDYNEQLLEKKHKVLFEWPHPASLNQASFLVDQFGISILSEPPNSIMLRFKIRDAGYLVYITKVLCTLPAYKTQQLLKALGIPN